MNTDISLTSMAHSVIDMIVRYYEGVTVNMNPLESILFIALFGSIIIAAEYYCYKKDSL